MLLLHQTISFEKNWYRAKSTLCMADINIKQQSRMKIFSTPMLHYVLLIIGDPNKF